MGRRMRHAPVYFTIAQVRHNPVTSLKNYVSDVQEAMRKSGYTDYKRVPTVAFEITAGPDGVVTPRQLPETDRFIFSSRESSHGFILDERAISFQTTRYGTYEDFSAEFAKGLDIVHRIVTLDFSERIGIRYLDFVSPRPGEHLSQYLVQEIHGIASRLEGCELQHSVSETVVKREGLGSILCRTITRQGRVGLPPDLQPMELRIDPQFENYTGLHAIIDTDASHEGRDAFDIPGIARRMNALHEAASEAFKVSVTKHAIEAWS
jgi:uncharacterized protein (TIGR04255 family)